MDKKFICDFPWIHISTFPQGNCTICCVAKHIGDHNGHSWNKNPRGKENLYLTVKNNSIPEIVNCDNYKSIRLDMLNDRVPEACQGCHQVEQAGGQSKRQRESVRNLDFVNLTKPDGSITPDLRHIELRLGNFCNLKCRSCNADSSTAWIQDYYKLKDKVELASGYDWIKSNSVFSFDWVDDESFYESLIEVSPNLEQVHISGGEPFLVPMHFKLLERLVNIGRTNVAIHYHTNLNYNFEKLRPALDLLAKFKEVHISFSIDDVAERNSYIRSLSNWDLTIKNLKLFLENYKFIYRVTQTISVYNFLYIEELEQYLKDNDISIRLRYNHAHSPDYLMALALPKAVRQEKIDTLSGKINDANWHDLYGHYYNPDDNGKFEYFKYFTQELDTVRNEELKLLFPRIGDLYDK